MLENALKQVTETQNAEVGVPSAPQEESPLSEVEKLKAELKKKEEQLTSKFHGLTARERMLMQKEMELKEKLGQVGSVDELRGLAEKDPLKLLEKFGLNYDKLTDIYAGLTPEDETKKTVGTLKSEIEELKNKLTEQESQGQMKEIMRVKAAKLDALKGLASREGSDYNLISHFGNYDDVLAYMSEHYNATGEILSDEEALNHIESQLADAAEEERGVVVDYHGCDFFPERWFDLVLVLRAKTDVLYDRLVQRGYSETKRNENMECEIMQIVLDEAKESYAQEIVHEVQSNTLDDMEGNVTRVEQWVRQWIKDNESG